VSHVFPLAVNPAKSSEVEPIGTARHAAPKATLDAPADLGIHSLPVKVGSTWTNPTGVVVTDLPLITEVEPNDDRATATPLAIPGGVNGRVGRVRDLDYFAFRGTKGKAVRFEVFARRFGTPLQSALDSVIDVLSPDGKVLLTNDDLNGKDAALTFTPAADGAFLVRLRDLNSKGGQTSPYFLSADFAVPDFTLKLDPAKAMLGPGSSNAWYVTVTRVGGFAGPVRVDVTGLPKGVTVNPLTIPANMTVGTLVLTAALDAPIDAANVGVAGTATIDGKEVRRPVVALDEIYLPGGGRGLFPVAMKTVAVTQSSDVVEVSVEPAKVSLKPGEEVKLTVTVRRRAGFTNNVNLDVILRHLGGNFANPLPTGVTMVDAKSKTLVPANAAVGHITLKAAPDAPEVADVPLCVMANVSINFVVKLSYTSKPFLLSVK